MFLKSPNLCPLIVSPGACACACAPVVSLPSCPHLGTALFSRQKQRLAQIFSNLHFISSKQYSNGKINTYVYVLVGCVKSESWSFCYR